jgi:hypothetical protein
VIQRQVNLFIKGSVIEDDHPTTEFPFFTWPSQNLLRRIHRHENQLSLILRPV